MEPSSEYTGKKENELFLRLIRDTIRMAKIQLYIEATGTDPFSGVGDNEKAREEAELKVEEFYLSTANEGSYKTPNGKTEKFNEDTFTSHGRDGTIIPGPDALRLCNMFFARLLSSKVGDDNLPNKE